MSRNMLLLSALIFFYSCNGTNKNISNASVEVYKTETITSKEQKSIEQADETIEEFNHAAWTSLLQKYVSSRGNVNYKGFIANSENFEEYLISLSKNVPQDSWTKPAKLAYWINAYNAFTVKLIIDKYPVKSIKNISNPWGYRFIKLGGKAYSLNDIEHKILRKMDEPRIHFAIVCASISCPKLLNTAFVASKLEIQLTDAVKGFLADSTRNNLSQNSIEISKIFKWFSSDFKQNGSLIDFLNKYSEITISQNARKSYKDYDWNLNE